MIFQFLKKISALPIKNNSHEDHDMYASTESTQIGDDDYQKPKWKKSTKRSKAIEIMKRNAHLSMEEVLPLIANAIDGTLSDARAHYRWLSENKYAPGVVQGRRRSTNRSNSSEEAVMEKSNKEKNQSELPQVFPMVQTSVDDYGHTVTKTVKPITYALMSFIKRDLHMPDIINISDDENRSQCSIEIPYADNDDDDLYFESLFDVFEDREFITFDVYIGSFELNQSQSDELKNLILLTNTRLVTGNFQIVDNSTIRYHVSIDFTDVASKDPNYSGPFLVHPQLIKNIYNYGVSASRRFSKDLVSILGN